jgi:DNA-3-methyladenine glycosylase
MSCRLPPDFYLRENVLDVARDLLGKVLCSAVDGRVTKAVIVETEAYAGVGDRASHAYGGRRTRRTEPMYAPGGLAYVYLCYGIHHLFNVVSGPRDVPHAVLVRAGVPFAGVELMRERRGSAQPAAQLTRGPGTLTQALGIRTVLTGTPLAGDLLWIEDHGLAPGADAILIGPRVGVDYAGEDAALPYRFRVRAEVFAARE